MEQYKQQRSRALPSGTLLPHNYIIEQVLGEGGFGITYCASSPYNKEKAAIKEYFPNEIAYRNQPDTTILPYSGQETSFKKGRQHFLKEASILKEFQHLNSIVAIKDILEANGTIYLVMEYIDGITLKQYVKENGTLSFNELLPLITPIIQDLIQIHRKGLIHRDISPDNIMVGIDNQLHLIDWGAASFQNGYHAKSTTIILKTDYAPPEQYLTDSKQGAWTDIYALCATMYLALTGFTPVESIKRIQNDCLPALAENALINTWQAAAIEKGMHVNVAERYRNMEAFYQALIISPIENHSSLETYGTLSIEENKTIMKTSSTPLLRRNGIRKAICVVLLFVALYGGLGFMGIAPFPRKTDSTAGSASESKPEHASDSLCSMINLVGKSVSDARHKLGKLDSSIQIRTEWVYDNEQDVNTVIDQSIAEGTSFTKGSITSVLLTVSRGRQPATSEQITSSANSSDKKKDSPDNRTATSSSKESSDNFDISPMDDDYETITID